MISVIVPTYNEAARIGTCVESLREQSLSSDRYEIIVVDDGSTDETAAVAAAAGAHVLTQENAGPAAARNTGAEAASGEILLFTDADCRADREWIERMIAPLSDPEIAGVRGVYRCEQRSLVARFAQLEYEEKYERLKQHAYVDFVDTSAAAYRRDVFLRYGGFQTGFKVASGEDTDLSFRISEAGHKLVLEASAYVYHLHPDRLATYLRRKYKTAYWRIFLYAKHPGKMTTDTHTPQSLKLQILLLGLMCAGTILGLVWHAAWLLAAGSALAFAATALPFVFFAARRDPAVALCAPLFQLARSAVFLVGLCHGALGFVLRRAQGPEAERC